MQASTLHYYENLVLIPVFCTLIPRAKAKPQTVVRHLMRVFNIIFTFYVTTVLFSCGQKKDDVTEQVEVRDVVLTTVVDEPPPPPPAYTDTSRFKSFQSWLNSICEQENTPPSVFTFHFGISDTQAGTTIHLYGDGQDEAKDGAMIKHNSFYPKDMYYVLSKEETTTSKEQALNKITNELKLFVKSDKFRHCFLHNGKAIITDWSGLIWSGDEVK